MSDEEPVMSEKQPGGIPDPVRAGDESVYHPDPEVNAEVVADALLAERADLAAGYSPRRWRCPCGAEHGRGHFLSLGAHRCLACGYVGDQGVMLG